MAKRKAELVKEQEDRKAERKVRFSINNRMCRLKLLQNCTC